MTARRRVVRVAVSRARAVWRRAKLARFAKAWRAFAAASASARATAALEHVHAWRAEAEKASRLEAAEARAAALFVPRRTRHAMREWRRATASSRAATLASKITELEGAKATLEAEREALRRAADVDRAAAREAAEREEETKASLAAAETRAAATAPFGGGLLDPVSSAGGNSNISHPVLLDTHSDSGLEVDELTAASTNGAAGRRSGPQSP